MAAPRYPTRKFSAVGRRVSFVDLTLALSVIVGLGFVSLRIKTMGFPAGWTQTTESSTVAAKADTLSPAAAETETKTP